MCDKRKPKNELRKKKSPEKEICNKNGGSKGKCGIGALKEEIWTGIYSLTTRPKIIPKNVNTHHYYILLQLSCKITLKSYENQLIAPGTLKN